MASADLAPGVMNPHSNAFADPNSDFGSFGSGDEGGEAFAVPMDVTDSASVKAAFDAAEQAFGLVTIIINNAGITIPKLLLDLSDEDWTNVVDTNLNGVAFVTREAGTRLVAQKSSGSIVNIASITAERLQRALTSYSAAKAAVVQFTKAAALEFARHDIRVNCISPGPFPSVKAQTELPNMINHIVSKVPMGRIGMPSELIGPIAFLASDASSFVTGINIPVDGGWTSW